MAAKIWVLLTIVTIARCRDIIVGSNEGGHKIYDENKQANPALWRQKENITIAANDSEIISRIIVTDLREEKDGDAKIVEGGEGQKNVTIELKSPTILRGYNFHIEAYAIGESARQDNGMTPSNNSRENSKEEANLSTSPSVMYTRVSLNDQKTLSSTSENPLELKINGKNVNPRQNRDTENKDQPNLTQILQETSTTQLHSTTLPTTTPIANGEGKEKQELENKHPSISHVSERDYDLNQPRIQLQPVSKMPESTLRNVALKDTKTKEDKDYHGGAQDNEYDIKNKQAHPYMEDRQTNVGNPRFNIYEVMKSQGLPIVNTDLPTMNHDNQNKSFRQKRGVDYAHNDPMVNIRVNQEPFSGRSKNGDGGTHNLEVHHPSSETQEHHSENGMQDKHRSTNTNHHHRSNFESYNNLNNGHVDNGAKTKISGEEQNNYNAFRGRNVPGKPGFNAANIDMHNSQSYTEMNKFPTSSSPINSESTKPIDGFKVYSPQTEITNQQSSTTNVPIILQNEATKIKSDSVSVKQSNSEIKTETTGIDNTGNSTGDYVLTEENNRTTRDTMNTNKKESSTDIPKVLTTLKPEIDNKNSLEVKRNNTNAQDKQEITIQLNDTKENSNKTSEVSVITDDKERKTRDTVSDTKNDKKDSELSINASKKIIDITGKTKTTKSEIIKNGQSTSETTVEPQKNVESKHIEVKSVVVSSLNTHNTPKSSEATDEKERNTRDTNAVNTTDITHNTNVYPSTDVTFNTETKKETHKEDTQLKNNVTPATDHIYHKPLISSSSEAAMKIANKNDKDKKQNPITVANQIVQSTTESQIHSKFEIRNSLGQYTTNVAEKEDNHSPKIPREAKETHVEGPTRATIEGRSSTSLETNFRNSLTTSNPSSVTSKVEDKPIETKQPKNGKDTNKSTEKPVLSER